MVLIKRMGNAYQTICSGNGLIRVPELRPFFKSSNLQIIKSKNLSATLSAYIVALLSKAHHT